MSEEIEPCRVCGAPVRLESQPAARRLGQEKADLYEVRVCTNAACNTNAAPNRRRLGSAP